MKTTSILDQESAQAGLKSRMTSGPKPIITWEELQRADLVPARPDPDAQAALDRVSTRPSHKDISHRLAELRLFILGAAAHESPAPVDAAIQAAKDRALAECYAAITRIAAAS